VLSGEDPMPCGATFRRQQALLLVVPKRTHTHAGQRRKFADSHLNIFSHTTYFWTVASLPQVKREALALRAGVLDAGQSPDSARTGAGREREPGGGGCQSRVAGEERGARNIRLAFS